MTGIGLQALPCGDSGRTHVLPELAEAASRSGDAALVEAALEQVATRTAVAAGR
jgi:hypothetical protein